MPLQCRMRRCCIWRLGLGKSTSPAFVWLLSCALLQIPCGCDAVIVQCHNSMTAPFQVRSLLNTGEIIMSTHELWVLVDITLTKMLCEGVSLVPPFLKCESIIFTFYFFFSKGDRISKWYFNGCGIKSIQLRRISFGEILLYCFLARKLLFSTFAIRWGRPQAFF